MLAMQRTSTRTGLNPHTQTSRNRPAARSGHQFQAKRLDGFLNGCKLSRFREIITG
jgi:hypothetical protein